MSSNSTDMPGTALDIAGLRFEPLPVTVGEYRQFCLEVGRLMPQLPEGQHRDAQPMTCVSFLDAEEYAKWKCRKTGRRFRITTEQEIRALENLTAEGKSGVWPLAELPDAGTTPAANTMQDPPVCDVLGVVFHWCADEEDRAVMEAVWQEVEQARMAAAPTDPGGCSD